MHAEPDTRTRRIANEWHFAIALGEMNTTIIRDLVRGVDEISMTLDLTPAIVSDGKTARIQQSHAVRFAFPRYYPAMPIEAFVSTPVLHPNVHPVTGFVCLWDRVSAGDTIIEAIAQFRRVLSWQLANFSAGHLMQPEAGRIQIEQKFAFSLPLRMTALVRPKLLPEPAWQRQRYKRQRLSSSYD